MDNWDLAVLAAVAVVVLVLMVVVWLAFNPCITKPFQLPKCTLQGEAQVLCSYTAPQYAAFLNWRAEVTRCNPAAVFTCHVEDGTWTACAPEMFLYAPERRSGVISIFNPSEVPSAQDPS